MSIALILLPIVVCTGIAVAYRNRTDAPKLAMAAEAVAILMATFSLGTLITYAAGAASYPFPYADTKLRAAGLALGFDWLAYARTINNYPLACRTLELAYNSFNAQPLLLLLVLVVSNQIARLRIFLLAMAVALAATSIIFIFMPAVSAYGHFGDLARQLTNIYPPEGDTHVTILLQHIEFLEGLRDGSFRQVSAQTLTGLITFPSFHACVACLYIWTAWSTRGLRVPVLLLNLLMLAASPLFGAHYIVDLISGAAVATFGVASATLVFSPDRTWKPRFRSSAPAVDGLVGMASDIPSAPIS
ncbi:phosphatase PAP2 family protein [Sphingomonas sp. UYAg733]